MENEIRKNRLNKSTLETLYSLIQKNYLADSRPWVIGYSGGKDSSVVLQLTWRAISKLPVDKREKPIFVLSSDTLVETPAIVNQLKKSHRQINQAAEIQSMPFRASVVVPEINNTFWVNLIGRGYPAPYTNFRWCTERMKIDPTSNFIKQQVAKYGEVVILLGARKTESISRGQIMAKRDKIGDKLSRHKTLNNAWVFTPIEDWETDYIWEYLTLTKCPWGGDNKELITMYRNAQSGECPLVIDKSTPTCGGGRFGCWTCTVVQKDRSMEAMVNQENGTGEWMEPLLEFRDWLTETQDPAKKENIREHRRRNGRIEYGKDEDGNKTKIIYGPYKMEFRKHILRKLLAAQKDIQKNGPDSSAELIQKNELHKIRQLWIHEEGDWEDSIPKIYNEIIGGSLNWISDDNAIFGNNEKELLTEICEKHGLNPLLLMGLIDVEQAHQGMAARRGIYDKLGSVLNKDWRTKEEAIEELVKNEQSKQFDTNPV